MKYKTGLPSEYEKNIHDLSFDKEMITHESCDVTNNSEADALTIEKFKPNVVMTSMTLINKNYLQQKSTSLTGSG